MATTLTIRPERRTLMWVASSRRRTFVAPLVRETMAKAVIAFSEARKDTGAEAILEQLIGRGADDMASVFARTFKLAMRIERERFLGVGHYERTASSYPPNTSRQNRQSGAILNYRPKN